MEKERESPHFCICRTAYGLLQKQQYDDLKLKYKKARGRKLQNNVSTYIQDETHFEINDMEYS